jgi:hypothetical protein
MTQHLCEVKGRYRLPRTVFVPEPKVHFFRTIIFTLCLACFWDAIKMNALDQLSCIHHPTFPHSSQVSLLYWSPEFRIPSCHKSILPFYIRANPSGFSSVPFTGRRGVVAYHSFKKPKDRCTVWSCRTSCQSFIFYEKKVHSFLPKVSCSGCSIFSGELQGVW